MRGLPLENKASTRGYRVVFAVAVVSVICFLSSSYPAKIRLALSPSKDDSVCPILEPKRPESYLKDNSTVLNILQNAKFREQSAQKLSGAVQVDTQIQDNQPDVPEAPEVWAKFKKFHAYLEKTFPIVYEKLDVTKVNTYGLVFHWKGSDLSLKPVMLMAHQDVVPVQEATLGDWTYPPFEGHYDGKKLYGRGASDCKNTLIGILEALELLLQKGYEPKRGIIAAFGFDEEASGVVGASSIGKYLEKKLGKDSVYAIIDEGMGLMLDPFTGMIVAAPGTGEKGYVDVRVELKTPGGHSSIPPDHTSIGLMSELVYLIERDQYSPIITPKNPTLGFLKCLAVNSGDRMSSLTRKMILRADHDKFANSKLLDFLGNNIITRYLVQTSQAVDIVRGGEKANALPEEVSLLVNHRIAVESSVEEVMHHFTERVVKLAKGYNIAVEAFGDLVYPGDAKASGQFVLSVSGRSLQSAPVTPHNDTVWAYLAGVTRHIFEDIVFPNLTYPIMTVPSIMTGNTDTRHYWNLTRNIFRYNPSFSSDLKASHVHSVDEVVEFDAHLQQIAFYYEYIQAVDTKDADNKA